MKDKLEPNMYVRTKDGIIDKVTIDYKGKCNNPNCNCKHASCQYGYYDKIDIINSSHNIIDLIEVGDYVNGGKVIDIVGNDVFVSNFYEEQCIEYIRSKDIKSIVTKEQFESMSYKIER